MTMSASKFSAEDRLNRKRQAARIRQQRCRARKRALAAAAVAAAKNPDAAPSQVIVDGNELKLKRKTQQTAKLLQTSRMPMYQPAQPPNMASATASDPHTTVDGVRMSKRAAVHAALLDEHNRKFFAQVEAERKGGNKKDNKGEGERGAPMSHVVVKNNHALSHKVSSVSTPTRTHSPMHPYYRHVYPPNTYYPYPAYGPRPHGKYTAPPHHHHPGGYPHSPPPPPMYRSVYDGRYHPIPPHALPQPTRHFPNMAPPQHAMAKPSSSAAPPGTVAAVVSHSVSDDDRSTPSQELSPTAAASDEEASYHSMDQKEQEAIAAMLTLSSASVDEAESQPGRQDAPPQPLVMSQ